MSLSNYRLKIQQGNTVYSCDLYTTPEEARSVAHPDHPRIRVNIGGTNYYCGTASDISSDIPREEAPVAVYYDETLDRVYRIAQKSFFKISITTKSNETITVTASNKPLGETGTGSYSFTSGEKYFPYGTTWNASVSGANGWKAGSITGGNTGTITNAHISISATAATHATYKITLPSTSQQTITIHYKNHNGTSLASSWSTTTSSVTLGYGSKYYLTAAGATGWTAGSISGSVGSSSSPLTLTAARTVTIGNATHKTLKITLTQKANETVTIHYKNHNGTSLASSWSTTTSSVTLGYGSKYYSTISASTGYTAGTITSAGSSSSPNTLTATTTISFTAASAKTYVLRYGGSGLTVKKTNSSGATISSGSSVNYNQVVWVKSTSSWDSYDIKLYKNSSASGTVWLQKYTESFTFNMPDSQVYIYNRSTDSNNGEGD